MTRASIATRIKEWALAANKSLSSVGQTWDWLYAAVANGVFQAVAAHNDDVDAHGGGGSGGGTPATTVTSETSFGIAPVVGASTNYARQDHTHGSPTAPTAASVGADAAGTAAALVGIEASTRSNADISLALAISDEEDARVAGDVANVAAIIAEAGTRAAADAAHVSAADPHPLYALEAALPAPATSVTNESTYGIAPAIGVATAYARQDHTHGSPTTPTAASVGADPVGTAAAGDAAHVVAGDPHTQYAKEADLAAVAFSGSYADLVDEPAAGITQLTGDVTVGPGSGSQAATVVKIGGVAVGGDPLPQYALETNLGDAALLDVGTAPGTVAAGDHGHAVAGDASGTLAALQVDKARGIRETSGPTTLTVGAVADGQTLKRVGNTIIGVTLSFTLAFAGDPCMTPIAQQGSPARTT